MEVHSFWMMDQCWPTLWVWAQPNTTNIHFTTEWDKAMRRALLTSQLKGGDISISVLVPHQVPVLTQLPAQCPSTVPKGSFCCIAFPTKVPLPPHSKLEHRAHLPSNVPALIQVSVPAPVPSSGASELSAQGRLGVGPAGWRASGSNQGCLSSGIESN